MEIDMDFRCKITSFLTKKLNKWESENGKSEDGK